MTTSTEKAVARSGWLTTRLPVALALLPLAYLVWMCVRLHVDVPFGDQWELVPRLEKLDAGTLSFVDVWRQHNEHRPLVPLLLMLWLAWNTDWNISVEIAVNVAIGIAITAVCLLVLRSARRELPPSRWWLVPILSLLLLSPAQWENWLWGWQMQLLMSVLSSLVGLWLLSGPGRSAARYAAALLCGVVTMYSVGTGLTYWLMGPVALRLNPDQRTVRRLAVWLVVAAVMIGTYFIDYHQVPGHAMLLSNFASPRAIGDLMLYTLKYLGAPVAGYSPKAALSAGAAGLVLFPALLVFTWRFRQTSAFIFPCLVGLNAIADAGVTALGRAGFGTDQALASRYQTVGAPFWVGILLLSGLAIGELSGRMRLSRRWVAAPIVAALALSASIVLNGYHGRVGAGERMAVLSVLRVHLRAGINWKGVARLYLNDVPSIKKHAVALQMMGMSVYRDEND